MTLTGGIYCIEHTASNRKYIGSAISFKKRWAEHKRDLKTGKHHNIALLRAYRKYGLDAFEFKVLEEVLEASQLISKEQAWMKLLAPEFNICKTAGSRLGTKHSPEVRAKMSLKRIGRKNTPEAIEKTAQAHRGRKNSEEVKARMSEAFKGRKITEEAKIKIANSLKGRVFSNETRLLISAAKKGQIKTPEMKAEMSKARTGKLNFKKRKFYHIQGPNVASAITHGLSEFCEQYDLNPTKLAELARLKSQKVHKGFQITQLKLTGVLCSPAQK